MSGNVQIGDKTYEIEFKGNNQHDITQVDPDKNPKHSHSKQPEDFLATGGQIDTTAAATAPTTSAATAGTSLMCWWLIPRKQKTTPQVRPASKPK